MASTAFPARTGFARVFAWPRLRFTLAVAAGLGIVSGLHNKTAVPVDVLRAMFMGCVTLFVFGVLEHRPRRLPKWLPRTVLRLIGVVLAVPLSAAFMAAVYPEGKSGLGGLVGAGLVVRALDRARRAGAAEGRAGAPPGARLRAGAQRARAPALDARLRLLQAQVAPHFLFNTLANVQALVDSGSPQASAVLRSLIAYLRAAVPRLHEPAATLGAGSCSWCGPISS